MLELKNVSFAYHKKPVLDTISLRLERGGHLAIMGESGSGKSTLLKAIYGLLELKHGEVHWNGHQVLGPNFTLIPGEKYMKYVSQDFELMPFTTVGENISAHLSAFDLEKHDQRVAELLQVIEMEDMGDVKVKTLSGGQKQRVALARALAQEPEILLLDEPFSNIDQFKKNKLRHRLFPYLREKNITVATATHDPDDVLSFADEVLILKDGEALVQEATAQLYHNPKLPYVAGLFGRVNHLPIKLLKDYAKTEHQVLAYPHELRLAKKSGFKVVVKDCFFKGSHYLIEGIREDSGPIFFNHDEPLEIGRLVYLNIALHIINKRLNLG
ncbi:MAG: ABC transporter ATP-binding protein [Muricauda sp.]|nr:ABC transporter ATP-binding protein [Allomuricauda sp.]MAU27455.1 ABC transporter ATP-binding protein [Allomuricauda sp.]MBC30243.1 ABC transporter ATP-binding protein [Allomuricauda sp.]|tara:strand:- start:11209 stop:12189 length:981 start_codon:yes stop_codon:yes gene_type:complete